LCPSIVKTYNSSEDTPTSGACCYEGATSDIWENIGPWHMQPVIQPLLQMLCLVMACATSSNMKGKVPTGSVWVLLWGDPRSNKLGAWPEQAAVKHYQHAHHILTLLCLAQLGLALSTLISPCSKLQCHLLVCGEEATKYACQVTHGWFEKVLANS
jgi:hypothetical protein